MPFSTHNHCRKYRKPLRVTGNLHKALSIFNLGTDLILYMYTASVFTIPRVKPLSGPENHIISKTTLIRRTSTWQKVCYIFISCPSAAQVRKGLTTRGGVDMQLGLETLHIDYWIEMESISVIVFYVDRQNSTKLRPLHCKGAYHPCAIFYLKSTIQPIILNVVLRAETEYTQILIFPVLTVSWMERPFLNIPLLSCSCRPCKKIRSLPF